jgi:thioredoxin-like negative regulator of GroEL
MRTTPSALELRLEETVRGDSERRERMRELAVALFGELGHEHPLTQRYRRRLSVRGRGEP